MEFVIMVGIVVIAISCLSIDGKLRKVSEQNIEIIELLKQVRKNKLCWLLKTREKKENIIKKTICNKTTESPPFIGLTIYRSFDFRIFAERFRLHLLS